MTEVTAPVSSFSSKGPSMGYFVPNWCTILIVLPDEVLKLKSSGSVGPLVSDLTAVNGKEREYVGFGDTILPLL